MDNVKEIEVSRIALINDLFRESGFGVTLTCGVQGVMDLGGLLLAIRRFKDFSGGNDPYHEHDFGRLEWKGDKVFWKIDYYNETLDGWEDPLSPKCHRVLTVMLAEEY